MFKALPLVRILPGWQAGRPPGLMASGWKCNLRTQGTCTGLMVGEGPTIRSDVIDWSMRGPDATFDLHGQTVLEAVANAEHFLRVQARTRRGGVVRLITGRGRAGGGAPIRTRVRTLLRGLKAANDVVKDYVLEDSEGSYLVRLAG